MTPSLDIVIVNWNSRQMLNECLASIATLPDISNISVNVFVIDNASTDGSLNGVEEHEGLALEVVRNDKNAGFAAACNQGAAAGSGDYILFLNPDTQLRAGALTTPILFMEDSENAAVAITGIQLIEDDGTVARSCSRFPTPRLLLNEALGLEHVMPGIAPGMMLKEWDHAETRTVDQVMGAFFLVRRPAFTALGGFDERFFVYFEDVDFSRRARAAGWTSIYLTDASVLHHGTGTTEQVKSKRLFYSLRSRIIYAHKHFRRPAAYFVIALTLIVEPVSRLLLALLHRSGSEIRATISAYGMLLMELPRLPGTRS